MKKRFVIPGVLTMAAIAGAFILPSLADAHHPEVSVSSTCIQPDESLVSITASAWNAWPDGGAVSDDHRFNSDVKVEMGYPNLDDSWVTIGHGSFTPLDDFKFTMNTVQKNTAGAVTVRVTAVAPWGPNGEYTGLSDTATAVVDLSDDCGAPTTSTTTTVAPGTPTTTIPAESVTIVRDFPAPATPAIVTPKFAG